jgi:hypothetical protein
VAEEGDGGIRVLCFGVLVVVISVLILFDGLVLAVSLCADWFTVR